MSYLLNSTAAHANGTDTSTAIIPVHPRISLVAFRVTTIGFLVLAILAAIARTGLRYRLYRKLAATDYLLILSGIVLIIIYGTDFHSVNGIYKVGVPMHQESQGPDAQPMFKTTSSKAAGELLLWAVIYGVKAGFAAFFRQLVALVRPLEIHWWIVVAFLAMSSSVTILGTLLFVSNTSNLIISTILDTVSDALLISIPIRLLWNLQKRLSQKLIAGGILSLSVVMIMVSIFRAAFAHAPGSHMPDLIWLVYWSYIEADVAVLMLSLTAFKTAFSHRNAPKGNENGR